MTENISKEIHLKNRPEGLPTENDFELARVPIPATGEGRILVQNIYMSVDPYMRGRMYDRQSYVPPFQIGKPLEGGCVGRVIESKNDAFKAGDYVLSMLGWREYFVSKGDGLTKIDPAVAPVQAYLGTAGMPGMTAYVGLLHIGELKEGETVFVSAAEMTLVDTIMSLKITFKRFSRILAPWVRWCARSPSSKAAMWSAAPARMKRSPGW